MRVRLLAAFAFLLFGTVAAPAKEDPVQWILTPAKGFDHIAPGKPGWFELKATIQSGWHLYSPTTPPGGPMPTRVEITGTPVVESVKLYRPTPVLGFDKNFNTSTETYSNTAVFLIQLTPGTSPDGPAKLEAKLRYQACTEVQCLPQKKTILGSFVLDAAAPSATFSLPAGYVEVASAPTATPVTATPGPSAPPANTPSGALNTSGDLLPFLLTAFGFGLATIFTPCVFPMIPITVSFFLNQTNGGEQRKAAWRQAIVFCLGIVVLFTGLGFLATAITGPFGVVQLGSSPWVNGFISIIFFIFGLSLLGAFELRLPSGLLTSLDRASQGGGYAGTLLMGLTFSLTSFACIGPIVGPLLVSSVQSKGWQPVLGMTVFAFGLALPFFFLALFPSYLKKLPRSGGWLARVKVVLGFIVLAAMLKYLSNIDQVLQTHWLTRERFLAGWIVLFALAGLYLLGFLKLDGMRKDEPLGVGRTLIAAVFLIFAISLVPGLFGARLGGIDAYIPEATGGVLNSGSGANTVSNSYFKNDLEKALTVARTENKLVLVNFTGYACTNCHWMKANIFPVPEVQAALNNLVTVDLYTDGTDAESDKNQQFEDKQFHTVSIPFYALIDADKNVIATFPQLTRNAKEFVSFLQTRPKV